MRLVRCSAAAYSLSSWTVARQRLSSFLFARRCMYASIRCGFCVVSWSGVGDSGVDSAVLWFFWYRCCHVVVMIVIKMVESCSVRQGWFVLPLLLLLALRL